MIYDDTDINPPEFDNTSYPRKKKDIVLVIIMVLTIITILSIYAFSMLGK